MRLALLILLAASACSPEPAGPAPVLADPAQPDPAQPDPAQPDVTPADIEADVHARTNAARRAHRLGTVAADAALADVARRHSADMAARGFFDHVTPDGQDANARAARAGMACRVAVSPAETRVGFLENLYSGGLYSRTTTTTRGAETRVVRDWMTAGEIGTATVDGWLASPGHRRNLLDGRTTREGVGVAVAPDGRVFVTQMLC